MSSQTVVSSTYDQGVKLQTGKYSTWYKIQNYFNQLNHVLNGVVACFMTLYFIREWKDSFSWHVFLTTIGYQLLMTEAIMVFYAPNSWTYVLSYKTKKHLHWILQSIATIFIITGNIIISVIRTTPHLKTIHAVTGLISMVFLVLSALQGVWAFFSFELRTIVKPVTSKFLHNVTSVLCFVIGMVSLIYGYRYGSTHDLFTSVDVEYSLIGIAIVTTVLSLIGAVKSEVKFLNNFCNKVV